jgi:cell division protein FtsQ
VKRQIFKYIFLSLGVVIVLGYLIFSQLQFKLNDNEIKCKNLNIQLSGGVQLITEQEVNDILRTADLHPIGVSLDRLKIDRIEKLLEENPLIRQAVCYHTPKGDVTVMVMLRNPKFLVNAADSYYVDDEKQILPVPLHVIAYVPVVTGRVTKSMATGKLYDFVDYVTKDKFWNAQIDQIHVRNDLKVELVPRVGDAIILLGQLNNYEEKLHRVFRLYQQAFKSMGWNRYKQLDVQYENQIVATRID